MLSSKNLLFAEKPYVTVLDVNAMEPRNICWSCLKVGKCLICSKCKIAAYCSVECQKEDWITTKQHKHECEVFQKADQEDMMLLFHKHMVSLTLRFIGRLVARKFEDGGVQPEQDRLKFPEDAVVKTLVDVPTETDSEFSINISGYSSNMITNLFNKTYKNQSMFFSEIAREDIGSAYFVMQRRIEVRRKVDGITDFAKLGHEVGVSLFMQMSRFRYSCDPDVVRIEENGISYFKLLKPEKQTIDMDQLTVGNQVHKTNPKVDFCSRMTFLEKLGYRHSANKECSYCNDEAGLQIRVFSIKEKCPDCGESLVYDPKHPAVKCFKCQSAKNISSVRKTTIKKALDWQNRFLREVYERDFTKPTYFYVLKECLENLDPVRCIYLLDILLYLLGDADDQDVLNAKYCGCIYSLDENFYVKCPSAARRGRPALLDKTFAALVQAAAALDPERSLVKKWGDRYRPGLNLEFLLPIMEVVRQGMAFHGLRLYNAIPVKLFMCKVYARAGLILEAMEVAVDARETMVLCYHEKHPKVKEWDTRLQELSRAK